jgi:hypothetical protein
MRNALWLLLLSVLALASCNLDSVGDCLGTAIGSSLRAPLAVTFSQMGTDVNRPDDFVARDGGVEFIVSGAHAGGRLVLTFDFAPVSATLPLTIMLDAGCASVGEYAFLYNADGGSSELNATLAVGDGGVSDAGQALMRFDVTQISVDEDGGAALPDRTLIVPVP